MRAQKGSKRRKLDKQRLEILRKHIFLKNEPKTSKVAFTSEESQRYRNME